MTDSHDAADHAPGTVSLRALLAASAGAGLAAAPCAASAGRRRPDYPVFSRIPAILTPDRIDLAGGRGRPGRREEAASRPGDTGAVMTHTGPIHRSSNARVAR